MKVLQLSDIHIGGEYNGKFNCRLNFVSTLFNALRQYEISKIVITGDLADCDYAANYKWIKDVLDSTKINYIVLPGNHDDVKAMRMVFGSNTVPESDYIYDAGVLYWNNCIDAELVFDKYYLQKWIIGSINTVFCHYPTAFVMHKFMEQHAHPKMDEFDSVMKSLRVEHVYCGHFHSPCTIYSGDYKLTVCASTQCELSPYESTCVPRMYMLPAANLIDIDAMGHSNFIGAIKCDPSEAYVTGAGFANKLNYILDEARNAMKFVENVNKWVPEMADKISVYDAYRIADTACQISKFANTQLLKLRCAR